MFDRLEKIIGNNNLEIIKNKKVLIVGLGGVGSFVLESLVRSGISNLIIVDHDIVDKTNLNRQLLALNSTIGMKKVDVAEQRIKDINKDCNVIKYDLFFDINTKDEILNNDIDFIVDCCDTVASKQIIIEEAIKRNIDFISSMGTANKMDPSKLSIVDIRNTNYDPLAKKMRKFIKDKKINKKVMVLSSTEQPIKNGNILGSTAFVPSVGGLLITSYIINKIVK